MRNARLLMVTLLVCGAMMRAQAQGHGAAGNVASAGTAEMASLPDAPTRCRGLRGARRRPRFCAAQIERREESTMSNEEALCEHVLYLLGGGGAHVSFDQAVAGLAPTLRGKRVAGVPFTAWRLVEHLRIAQWDILEFSRNPKHVSPEFPEGYWPAGDAPPYAAAWKRSIDCFHADLSAMKKLVKNRASDLFTPFPHGDGQTLLREALLIADHNAYHIGQIVTLRRLMSAWKKDRWQMGGDG